MVIVVVRWYIIKGRECDFEKVWRGMIPDTKDGLFREFFSKPVDKPDPKYHTLDFESEHYTTFINVGVWGSVDDFDNAINTKIPGREPDIQNPGKDKLSLFNFEFKLRERIAMDVLISRGGGLELPEPNL